MPKHGKQKVTNFVGGDSVAFLRQQCEMYDRVEFEFTNYTAAIITPKGKYVFHPSAKIKKPFHVFNALKKQIKDSGKPMPVVDRKAINWYKFRAGIQYPESFDIIDLTSAYAHALKRYGAIDAAMYRTLTSEIPKEDRLSAVGFLGTKKTRIIYERGEGSQFEVVSSELSDWFFWCCYVTGEIMELAKRVAGPNFLFYWVDGIAVTRDSVKVLNYVRGLGYPAKIETITEASFDGTWLRYKKDGKQKTLCVPKKRTVENHQAIQFLEGQNKEYNNGRLETVKV